MCGIAGIVSFREKIDSQFINNMTDIIRYRGPDDEGAIAYNLKETSAKSFKRVDELCLSDRSNNIYLGHRRLSIIDLSSAGHQPMEYTDHSLWITYNGEIYNYLEIKEELVKYGYSFKTKTDTEVILAAYHKWGEDCLLKFNGMWSFAILDIRKDKLFCSVDQFGIKPFYYSKKEDLFCFSSEAKQLLILPWINRNVNKEYLMNLFGYQQKNDFYDTTLFENIMKLKAGHFIRLENLSSSNPEFTIQKWYAFDTKPSNFLISEKEASEKFYELFYDSVKLRLRSDVQVGTALSGGIDSSAIVVTMDKILKETGDTEIQKTFTAGSEVSEIDETKYAKQVLEMTNAKGYFVLPTSEGFINELEKMYYHIEIPYISSSCYASWCVYKLVKESGVTVTLDGQGSDEILAGYDIHMYPSYQTQNLFHGNLSQILPNARKIHDDYKVSYTKQFYEIGKKELRNIKNLRIKYDTNRLKKENLFNSEFKNYCRSLIKSGKESDLGLSKNILSDSFSNNLKINLYSLTLPILLNIVDKNSMAHSVEARLPFLDYRLLQFIYSLPHTYKINKGITKYILKKSFEGLLPNEILNRFKIGFVTSEKEWFLKEINFIKDIIDNSDLIKQFFNADEINKLYNDVPKNSNRIWKLLSLSVINKNFERL